MEEIKIKRKDILEKAIDTVAKDRNYIYGEPEDTFGTIARLWSAYLNVDIVDSDVAFMMILLKIARAQNANFVVDDNLIDIAGYAACASELMTPPYRSDDTLQLRTK